MYRVFPQILCVTWMYWPVCYHHFQSWVVVEEAKFPVEFRAGSVIFHLVGSSSAHSNRVAREIRNFCNEEKSQRRYLLGSICQPLEHTTTQTKIQSCNLEQFLCALFYIFVFSCCLASFSNAFFAFARAYRMKCFKLFWDTHRMSSCTKLGSITRW